MSRKPTTNLTQLEAFAKEEWGIIELDTPLRKDASTNSIVYEKRTTTPLPHEDVKENEIDPVFEKYIIIINHFNATLFEDEKQDKMKKDIIQNECQIDEEDVNSSDRVDPSKFLKLKSSVNNNQRMLKFVILQSVLKMASSGYMRSTPDTGSPQVIQKLQERSFRL
ncbi:unnamed protein product [Lepeophtheirus salmonis]|uniref:(salmon louse) hypothetical protein n=1 Tax=Lepeophtheirus salmonis TaxID=72036 RepID=A0A7R8CDA0_LEPSM|nr:unnamed protein product [Lepeophtheirus salmonis]CAF2778951.1 unnamed protein product [Lepeophtheirus salmonis]